MRAFVVMLAACSSTPIAPTAPAPAPAATPKVAPAPAPDASGDESQLEHAVVQGNGLRVDVSWMTMTGTTHVASQVVLTTASGKLELTGHPEQGDDPPLIEQVESLGNDRWLVLGWTSYGGGMQTEHAWIVDATPRVVDALQWTSDRTHAGLAIDPNAKPLRVGIPLPAGGDLHDETDWGLVHGPKSFTLAEVGKLPASNANPMQVRTYTPPFVASASDKGWKRYVWFTAGATFVN